MSVATTQQDRLAELVASLSGSPDDTARQAMEAAADQTSGGDPLELVASALVALRRAPRPALAGV